MKHLLYTFFFLSLSVAAFAQPSGYPVIGYSVPTIAAMKAYVGSANQIHVDFTNGDYTNNPLLTANEINIFAGTGGKKWKKNESKLNADSLVKGSVYTPLKSADSTTIVNAIATHTTTLAAMIDSVKVKNRIKDSLDIIRAAMASGVAGVSSVNGTTGAITIDTSYISNFYLKVRNGLFSGAKINPIFLPDNSFPDFVESPAGTFTLADNNIASSKLTVTGVTAGSYTNSTITVDSKGRITAASTGTAYTNFDSSFFAGAGNNTTPLYIKRKSETVHAAIGDIYRKYYFSNLSDFETNAGFSVSSGGISVASDNSQANYLRFPNVTGIYKYKYQVDYFNTTKGSGTNSGLWMKFISNNTSNQSQMYVHLIHDTADANWKKITITSSYGSTWTSATALSTLTLGDEILLSFERLKSSYIATALNVTTGQSVSVTIQNEPSAFTFGGSGGGHNAVKFNIVGSGGTYTIKSIIYSSAATKHPKFFFDGDSITFGSSAGSVDSSYWARLGGEPDYGGGDRIEDQIAKIPEIINTIQPSKVFLLIGTNNTFNSTFQTNYQTFVTTVEAAGIPVIKLAPPPNNNADMSAFKNWIASTYPTTYIDLYTPLKATSGAGINATYNAGDGVHPNNAGHSLMATTIAASPLYYKIVDKDYEANSLYTQNLSQFQNDPGYIKTSDIPAYLQGRSGYVGDGSRVLADNLTWVVVATNAPPVASSVTQTGIDTVGKVHSLTYTYSDAESNTESGTLKKWYSSSTIGGTKTLLTTASTYTVQSGDVGKYIYGSVIPGASTGTSPGAEVFSSNSTVIKDSAAGGGYDTDATAWFAAVEGAGGTISSGNKTAYSTFIAGLKSDGLWTKTVGIFDHGVTNSFSSNKFNMKTPSDVLTQTGTGTFSNGFTNSAGTSDGLTASFGPTTGSPQVSFGAIVTTNSAGGAEIAVADVINGNHYFLITNLSANPGNIYAQAGRGSNFTTTNSSTIGRWLVAGNATDAYIYKNGTQIVSQTLAIVGPPNNTVKYQIGGNNFGSATDKIGITYFFSYLTSGEAASLDARLSTLQTAIGR